MVETEVLIAIDFEKAPEFVAEIDRARVSEFQLVEESNVLLA